MTASCFPLFLSNQVQLRVKSAATSSGNGSYVFGVTRFHAYLMGRHFTLITDHKPLLGLLNEKKPIPSHISVRIQRRALTLDTL